MKALKSFLLFFVLSFGLSLKTQAVIFEFEPDTKIPLINITVAVPIGSAHDPLHQSGLTKFTAEMLLRGTAQKTKKQIDLALDELGSTLDVEVRSEMLLFQGSLLSRNLSAFLALFQEILTEPHFPISEIKKLKAETISEIDNELGNDQKTGMVWFQRFFFTNHPYANSILGKKRDINQFTQNTIKTHYKNFFGASSMYVLATGDAEKKSFTSFLDILEKKLPNHPVITSLPAPKTSDKRRLILINKPNRTQTQIFIGQPGIKMSDSNYFPLYLGNYSFGGGSFSARMMKQIRAERGWSYGAYSTFRFSSQPRSWHMYFFPSSLYTPQALAYALKMLEDLKNKGFTQEEFNFAQTSLINHSGFLYDTPKKRLENKLTEETLNLPKDFTKSYAEEIKKLTLEKVNQEFKNFIKPDTLTILVLATVTPKLKKELAQAAQVLEKDIIVRPYSSEE